jgi:hypothetical protein
MKFPFFLGISLLAMLTVTVTVSCAPAAREPLALASFSENFVEVSISLEHDATGSALLAATFTPASGHHVYSKDIPARGLEGLGRPTLLELTSGSRLTALGELIESVAAQEPDFEPKELLIYPEGPVTLRLPVRLPPGREWIEDEIKVTYMACTAYQCKAPVEGKIVQIRIPGEEAFASQ